MDDQDELVVRVRGDAAAFARDVAAMRGALDAELTAGARSAGRSIEASLREAARRGRLDFEDFGRAALGALADVAAQAAALRLGGGGAVSDAATALAGAPGRAIGGPVSPGRPYRVGEAGPEWFVPASAGSVVAAPHGASRGAVNVTVNVAAPREASGAFMTRTAAQVARAVRGAIEGA